MHHIVSEKFGGTNCNATRVVQCFLSQKTFFSLEFFFFQRNWPAGNSIKSIDVGQIPKVLVSLSFFFSIVREVVGPVDDIEAGKKDGNFEIYRRLII